MSEQYEYLVRGALLQCSCGSCQRRLNLPLCHGVYIGKNPVMNSGDYIPEVNVMSFGTCSKTGSKCIPGFAGYAPWLNVNRRLIVGDEEKYALTTNSYLECVTGGRITVVTSGQEYKMTEKDKISKEEKFELTKEERSKIDNILASDGEWKDKVIEIKHIYERHLYNLAPEAFDDYVRKKKSEKEKEKDKIKLKIEEIEGTFLGTTYNDRVMEKYKIIIPLIIETKKEYDDAIKIVENDLSCKLKDKVDIRRVGEALSKDVLRAIPTNDGKIVSKLYTFYDLVKTGAPMDLKTHELSEATGKKEHDFSIWSRPWEYVGVNRNIAVKYKNENDNDNDIYAISPDYMGNFTFGYVGADYFKGLDYDDYTTTVTMIGASGNFLTEGAVEGTTRALDGTLEDGFKYGVLGALNGLRRGVIESSIIGGFKANRVYTKTTESLRKENPDKTDEEMMLLLAAGVAQFGSDLKDDKKTQEEDFEKFKSSLLEKDSWGDNEKDPEYIKDGVNYYYKSNGIDKEKLIEKARR